MSKFADVYATVGGRFASSGLVLYPEDYRGELSNNDLYGRYSIIFGDADRADFDTGQVISGLVLVRVFYKRGEGNKNAIDFADTLNTVFEDFKDESFSMEKSRLSNPQDDPDDEALAMMIWQAPFNKYL